MNSRIFKFRIWDKWQNKWIDEKLVCLSSIEIWNYSDNGYITQQFTGLKDSKNIDIYEGDILNQLLDNKSCYYVVEWGNQSDYCGFGLRPLMKRDGTFRTTIHDFKMYLAEGFEVIGNIFENPELLK